MRNAIMVVGGYGVVGRHIVQWLMPRHRVIIAGRTLAKAQAFKREIDDSAEIRIIDIAQPKHDTTILDGVCAVVMCVEQDNTRFVEMCLQNGVHYVDISASYRFLRKVRALSSLAEAHSATAVIGVGLAPGLTNLAAKEVASRLTTVDTVEIMTMLGLGDEAGQEAVAWTLGQIGRTFPAVEKDNPRLVRGFTEGKRERLSPTEKLRTVYRFDFADQHIVAETLGVPTVATYLTFDVRWMNWLMAKTAGLLRFSADLFGVKRLVKLFEPLHIGSDQFVGKVTAIGTSDGHPAQQSMTLSGRNQSRATALAAAFVVESLCTRPRQAGVFYIDEQFGLSDMKHLFQQDNALQLHIRQ